MVGKNSKALSSPRQVRREGYTDRFVVSGAAKGLMPLGCAPLSESFPANSTAFGAGTGFIHLEGSPLKVLAVQSVDSRLGFSIIGHLDKAESLRSSGIPVGYDSNG